MGVRESRDLLLTHPTTHIRYSQQHRDETMQTQASLGVQSKAKLSSSPSTILATHQNTMRRRRVFRRRSRWVATVLVCSSSWWWCWLAQGFGAPPVGRSFGARAWPIQGTPEDEGNDSSWNMEGLNLANFRRRKEVVERKALQRRWQRPPNPLLGPTDLVTALLEELRSPQTTVSTNPTMDTSGQHPGVLALLETSSSSWRKILCRSVGASEEKTSNQYLVPSLEAALGRPNNQFAILMGVEDTGYQITFPTDPLDFEDGTCWVECRLRGGRQEDLLVAMGWSLVRRATDGAWIVDALDWQDFREAYRPGIGREEWMRICG